MKHFYTVDKKSKIVLLFAFIVFLAIFGPWSWNGSEGGLSYFFWITMLSPIVLAIISSIGLLLDKGENN